MRLAGSCMGPWQMGSGAMGHAHRRPGRAGISGRLSRVALRSRAVCDQWHPDAVGPACCITTVAQVGGGQRVAGAGWRRGGAASRSPTACGGRDADAVRLPCWSRDSSQIAGYGRLDPVGGSACDVAHMAYLSPASRPWRTDVGGTVCRLGKDRFLPVDCRRRGVSPCWTVGRAAPRTDLPADGWCRRIGAVWSNSRPGLHAVSGGELHVNGGVRRSGAIGSGRGIAHYSSGPATNHRNRNTQLRATATNASRSLAC